MDRSFEIKHLSTQIHIKYDLFILKIHRPAFYGGIYLLWSYNTRLPPQMPKIHADITCQLKENPSPMTMFAFRTHAHKHGTVITGYRVRDGKISEIARGDPQKPQMFYPMTKPVVVENGDYIHARCTFNTTMEDRIIRIGNLICVKT